MKRTPDLHPLNKDMQCLSRPWLTNSHSLALFTHKVDILTDLFLFVLMIYSQYVLKGYWHGLSMNPSLYPNTLIKAESESICRIVCPKMGKTNWPSRVHI